MPLVKLSGVLWLLSSLVVIFALVLFALLLGVIVDREVDEAKSAESPEMLLLLFVSLLNMLFKLLLLLILLLL